MSTVVGAGGARIRAMAIVAAATAGALFGIGLLLSGMTRPARVVGFLDPTRGWDPSLAFVMGGAMVVYAGAYHLVRRRWRTPWLDTTFHVPSRRDIDVGLVVGAAIFGVGWGLGGLCPGPALVSAAAGSHTALTFVAAMLVGMLAQHGWSRR